MRLSDLFQLNKGQVNKEVSAKATSVNSAPNLIINKQIKALIPGQTIQGEVISLNGEDVIIKLSDDMLLNAKLDQNMQLLVGKGMTFEVKNNGASLILSPLFSNMSTDVNVLKALDMASLPTNPTTIEMTSKLMEAGMPIDRNSLQAIFREIQSFIDSPISDIIDLHKLGLEVSQENLNQMASYKNLTHQLVSGMTDILNELPVLLTQMIENGAGEDASKLFQTMLNIALEGESGQRLPAEGSMGEMTAMGNEMVDYQTSDSLATGIKATDTQTTENIGIHNNTENTNPENTNVITPNAVNPEIIDSNLTNTNILSNIETENLVLNLANTEDADISVTIQNTIANIVEGDVITSSTINDFLTLLQNNTLNTNDTLQLVQTLLQKVMSQEGSLDKETKSLLTSKEMTTILQNAIKDNWTIQPEALRNPEKLNELYNRIQKQLNTLSEAMKAVGQTESSAAKSVQNLSQNVDFLNQINQLYTYVQLPLKMNQGNRNGELYVYSRKKNLSSEDGNISALLHLDMEHLGKVDVYISLQHEKVNTKFYVADDDMLDFLEAHMDILTKRLQEKGYNMSCTMKVREDTTHQGTIMESMLEENAPNNILVQYAFDVRA